MLEKVKLALRITHTLLDSDITDTIALARAEMERAGVSSEVAVSSNPLVESAIRTYCLSVYSSSTEKAEAYFKSWQYQLDNLRKSTLEV